MNKHQYRITVESLDGEGAAPLSFSARCHDDLLAIVGKTRSRGMLTEDDAAAMAVGLKLLGEIALEHRKEPLYAELCEAIGAFIRKLKGELREGAEPG